MLSLFCHRGPTRAGSLLLTCPSDAVLHSVNWSLSTERPYWHISSSLRGTGWRQTPTKPAFQNRSVCIRLDFQAYPIVRELRRARRWLLTSCRVQAPHSVCYQWVLDSSRMSLVSCGTLLRTSDWWLYMSLSWLFPLISIDCVARSNFSISDLMYIYCNQPKRYKW